ncbi:MAG TPA: oxidative damage protection protein [Chloroflexota bacterium]|nr:oxidative damage protection protein [Chloroflexota bacterium]
MPRQVMCAKFGRELPGLERPPFPGPEGERIFEHVSAMAWEMWGRQSVVLINHYGLVLADPEAQKFLREQREAFLFQDQEQMPEGWSPDDQGGVASSPGKGAPAPAPAKK